MNRVFLTWAIFVCVLSSFAQNGQVYDTVDTPPVYPGGKEALASYLGNNLKYPVLAEVEGIQGKVTVSFVVEKDGSVNDAKVINSVHPLLDKEAMRVVNAMPKWTPGRKGDQIVRVRYSLPVSFRLDAPVVEQSAEIHKVWVEQNYDERNKCTLTVYADFTVYGMENYKGLIQMRIRNSKGEWVKMQYAKESKDGSYYYEREFNPEYYGTTYSNHSWFMYWNEMLKLKNKKQYELILTIISTKNGKTLAESSPVSFIASSKIDPASKKYTPITYTPVQYDTYQNNNYNKNKSSSNKQSINRNSSTATRTSTYNSTSRNTTSEREKHTTAKKHTWSTTTFGINKSEKETCSKCKGTGKMLCVHCNGKGVRKCYACDGKKWNPNDTKYPKKGRPIYKCNKCNSTGSIKCPWCHGAPASCSHCSGRGWTYKK